MVLLFFCKKGGHGYFNIGVLLKGADLLINQLLFKFTSLQSLLVAMPTGLKGANNSEGAIQFYTEWNHYLDPTTSIIAKIINYLLGHLLIFVYGLVSSTEKVFMATFKLIGLTDTFNDKGSVAYKFFVGFHDLGLVMAGLAILILTITNILRAKSKYKSALTNIILVLMVSAILPWGLSQIGGALNKTVASTQGVSATKMKQTLASQPITDNTVDLIKLARGGFNDSLTKDGVLKVGKSGGSAFNDLTSSGNSENSITHVDFGQTISSADTDMVKSLNNYKKGSGDVFTHELYTSKINSKTGKVVNDVIEISKHSFLLKSLNAFEPVYTRYQVNWIPAFAQLLILGLLFITLAIRIVKSVFDIITMGIISPYVGLVNLRSSRKYKELLTSIAGAFASMELEIVVIRIMMLIMDYVPTVISKAGNLGLGEQGLLNIVVYLGAFYGCFSGVGFIEKYTGVSQGHGDEAQQIAATAGLGMAAGAMGSSLISGAKGAGQWATGKGGSVTGRAGNGSTGLPGLIDKSASAMGAVGEAVSHPVQSAKAGVSGIKNGVQSSAQGIADKFHSGQDSVNSHFDAGAAGSNGVNGSGGAGTTGSDGTSSNGVNGAATGSNDGQNGSNGNTGSTTNSQNGQSGINSTDGAGTNGENGNTGMSSTSQDGQSTNGINGIDGRSGENGQASATGLTGSEYSGTTGNDADGATGSHTVVQNSDHNENGISGTPSGTSTTNGKTVGIPSSSNPRINGSNQPAGSTRTMPGVSTPQTSSGKSNGLPTGNNSVRKGQVPKGNAYKPKPDSKVRGGATSSKHAAKPSVNTKPGSGIDNKTARQTSQQTEKPLAGSSSAKQSFNTSEQKFAAGKQQLSQSMQRMTQSSQKDHVTGRDFEDDDDDQS